MIDFVDSYMTDINNFDDGDFDEQRILVKSISQVLPLILENELTQKQRICMELHYKHGKSQTEIARELRLSQPTVCRHIKTAKAITNKFLSYCFYSLKKANAQWLKVI